MKRSAEAKHFLKGNFTKRVYNFLSAKDEGR